MSVTHTLRFRCLLLSNDCLDPVPAVQAAPQGDRGAGRHGTEDLHGEARHLLQ